MEPKNTEDRTPGRPAAPPRRTGPNFWFLAIVLVVFVFLLLALQAPKVSEIPYDFFLRQLGKKSDTEFGPSNILDVKLGDLYAEGIFDVQPPAPDEYNSEGKLVQAKKKQLEKNFRVQLPYDSHSRNDLRQLLERQTTTAGKPVRFTNQSPTNPMMVYWLFSIGLSLAILVFIFFTFRRARDQFLGTGFLTGFSKSPAKRYEGAQLPVTFKDVAGLDGVKADLMEIVDYLKSPEKFQRLGGRVPKGVLLNGPPGTGKTLLARAVAGEAGAPFFSVSGSEFIQMFVGVGASRVRDLFKTAKEASPAIIFIDEIDAVGRQRGAGLGGGHDEREQTLNQILSEMDGFTQTDSVIVLAATNRPDVLDPALLRPGRFDRHVTVGRPTHKGRVEIFNVHVRDVPLDADVNIETLASGTVGLTGADIRNIVNEAALWAARQDKTKVEMADFEYARDKVLIGAKREEILSDKEKEKTAYHEAGHTLAAWHSKGAHPVHKVTIIPRGRTLGATHMLPSEDRLSMSESELRDQLVVALAGRAAEKMIYNEASIGAENDLERATSVARRMVTYWGMSERLGPVSYKMSDEDPFLGREIHQQRQFSEHTMELIDEEVARILHEASDVAVKLLTTHRGELDKLTESLLQDEELDEKQIANLIGPSVHPKSEAKAADASKSKSKSKSNSTSKSSLDVSAAKTADAG